MNTTGTLINHDNCTLKYINVFVKIVYIDYVCQTISRSMVKVDFSPVAHKYNYFMIIHFPYFLQWVKSRGKKDIEKKAIRVCRTIMG